jgi:hypothetical protein
MTDYTSRVSKYEERDPFLSLARARELMGLDLDSARETISYDGQWTYHPSSRNLRPDDIFGVFVLEKTEPDGLRNLMTTMEDYGLALQYSPAELEQSLQALTGKTEAGPPLREG